MFIKEIEIYLSFLFTVIKIRVKKDNLSIYSTTMATIKLIYLKTVLYIQVCVVVSDMIFYNIGIDKRLQATIYKKIKVNDPSECPGHCLYTPNCRSYNVLEISDGQYSCELLDSTGCNSLLIAAQDYSFYTTKDNSLKEFKLKMGEFCIWDHEKSNHIEISSQYCSTVFTFQKESHTLKVGNLYVCPGKQHGKDIQLLTGDCKAKWKLEGNYDSVRIKDVSSTTPGCMRSKNSENSHIMFDEKNCEKDGSTLFKVLPCY